MDKKDISQALFSQKMELNYAADLYGSLISNQMMSSSVERC